MGSNAFTSAGKSLPSELLRIDTATSAVTVIPIDGVASGVALGGGAVWVSSILVEPTSIFRIDPATNRVVERRRLPSVTQAVSAGPDGVWVTSVNRSAAERVFRLNPRTLATELTVSLH